MLSNKKEHYKMYKSGKMWVYSSVVIATLLGGATTVSADTSSNATSNVSSASSASSTATQASTTSSLNSKTTNKAEINAKDTTLIAGPNTKWTAEDNFVSATDQTGKDVAFTNLTTEGSVDTNKVGQYEITYKFTDVDGTVVSKTITVTVEKSKSKIETKDSTLVTGSNTKWAAGDNFISATDQNGSSIDLKDIQVSGSVDTTKAGKYSVTYSYQDNSGNEVSQIATVTVVNNETSKNVDSNTKNNVALRSITATKEVSGVNVTTSFQNDDTFSNGTGTIALNVVIDKTATIKKGSVLSFKISNPDAINWNNIQLNGGTNYGSLTYDQQSGTIKYTFNVDVVNGDINFIVNIHPTAADINNTTISSDVDGVLVPISGGTSFNNKKSSDNGGGTYNEQRLIIGNGSYGFSGTPENYVGYINGKNYYLPNRQSMNYNIVLDPGFYTEKENDKTGRKIQLTISGSNASIDLDSLYITEKGGYPNTSQSYVSLKSMGWTFKQISPTSVEIDIPDGFNMGWYLLGIVPKTPDLDSEYKLTANYSSDAITAAQTTSTSGYFQNISNKGFVPQITAEDKSINRSSNNSNLSDWLLNNVSASDVEDGNLDNKISITDDQDFLDAWNKNENGSYKVTYSVTDKDGNTTTKIINVTIYSNITIHYVDQDGKALQSDTTLIANSNGETYSITPVTTITKENNVYNYVSASASLNGTYGSNNQPTEITLTYHASQATIAAKDSTLVAGPNTKWTASDNFISATDQAGNPVELKDITVKGSVDTT
ncbi:bacterial Ig-like domain-containing protein, partial [Leuconostoc falkenbergense]|uniref:bacterial Ig-like domain-containing protein n=1 Tax=Leuconostoc falkenbergense TaxID=2766470 RepID=UPI0024AE3F4C